MTEAAQPGLEASTQPPTREEVIERIARWALNKARWEDASPDSYYRRENPASTPEEEEALHEAASGMEITAEEIFLDLPRLSPRFAVSQFTQRRNEEQARQLVEALFVEPEATSAD